ncbi:sporulation integral membrane protein YtvI [Virgibacillus halodenitrificans]|uniref:Sporulation integral membrane protein YtvI n=1 Tax=Virgibacillus halodenitrificans TaxID=1482 RepID=A0AAC9IYP6_VIRHA|nr:sporulation integral membrane protein YtvI [Virgibacillus halodenitrificans]APC48047.1 sporulation integral membrane protein YtvI [Virgibacillus halodenitrificans]
MYKQLFPQIARFLIVVFSILILYILIRYTGSILLPIIIATILAIIIHPLVSFMEKKLKFPRIAATFSAIILIFLIMIGGIFLLITEVIQGTVYLAEHVPTYFRQAIQQLNEFIQLKILPFYEKLLSIFNSLENGYQSAIEEYLKQATSSIAESGSAILQDLLLRIPSYLTMLPGSITIIIFLLLATFIITNDLNNLKNMVSKAMPVQLHSIIRELITQFKKTTLGFIKAQIILVIISAIIIFVGLTILNIKHAFTISLFAIVVDLLPYIGTGIIFIPWILFLYITAEYTLTIRLVILYMIVIIVRQVIEPKVLSSSIGIHPLVALITLFAGVQLWGIMGFLLTPVFLIILNVIYQADILKKVWLFIRSG